MSNQRRRIITTHVMITAVILVASTSIAPNLHLLSSPNNNNYDNNNRLAFAQSELIGRTSGANPPNTNNFNLASGYTIKPVVWNLTAPDSITFDNKGNMYIGEAGYPFTNLPQVPRILKVTPTGNLSIFIDRKLNSPIVDIVFHNGLLYVSHNHKISTVNPTNAVIKDIIVGLPTNLNHQNNQIAFSPAGKRLYVGIGSATNSGVVGEDDYRLGWLANDPKGHDIPGRNITLSGQNFITKNVLRAEPKDNATTGAFVPFGTSTHPGQVIPGDVKCNGCIVSANLDGTDLKVVGWGFRNPTGLAFNEQGRLFVENHGADERGSRPIANDSDKLNDVNLNKTAFYGWPDFFGNAQPVTDPIFQSPSRGGGKPLEFLMQSHPPVEKPLMLFRPVHASGIQMAFANRSSLFGFSGEAFVAQIGTDAPISRPLPPPGTIIGQNIVHVNIHNKTISDFLTLKKATTAFRPTDIVFSQNGTALYIVDWGNVSFTNTGPNTTPHSGVVWKITHLTTADSTKRSQ
jgi:glucose/arabinose dehydrogenase